MLIQLETLIEKKLVGKHLITNFVNNRTTDLWKSFMPHRNEVKNALRQELYSVNIYAPTYFKDFKPGNDFEKWAAIEVNDFHDVPPGMDTLTLVGGLYAVFLHKGPSTDTSTFHFIFSKWLPASEYVLDNRPHFEVMGEKYKHDDPDSEEEIWIPVKKKEDAVSAEALD